jgi:SAM-dependent methyltransferase
MPSRLLDSRREPPRASRLGYDELPAFLRAYGPASAAARRPPSLDAGLAALADLPQASSLSRLPPHARCLIEGSATAENPAYLKAFLATCQVTEPAVTVIDLVDVQGAFRAEGREMACDAFAIADAAKLEAIFADASFDLVVQDHLLNCAPHGLHADIMRELGRVLRPGGFFIVSYTDSAHCDLARALTPADLRERADAIWSEDAYCLRDLGRDAAHVERLRERLCGATVRLGSVAGADDRCVFVTPPFGNFEFFAPHARTEAVIASCGLTPVASTRSIGRDAYGFACHRWHCLYRR